MGGQAQTSLHKSWLGGIEKFSPPPPPPQGIEPRVFGFQFRNFNHWATSPVLLSWYRKYYWRSNVEIVRFSLLKKTETFTVQSHSFSVSVPKAMPSILDRNNNNIDLTHTIPSTRMYVPTHLSWHFRKTGFHCFHCQQIVQNCECIIHKWFLNTTMHFSLKWMGLSVTL